MSPTPSNPTPLLIAIDIQREYVTPGRPHCLEGIEPALENCRSLLAHARAERWPVVHVRHIQESHLFNEKLPYSRFVEGFEPLAHEMVFTKSLYSCFSSPEFAEFMETTRQHLVYVMGFDAQRCCFSTLVDAAHRSMRLTFVADASLSRRTALGDEQQSHRWVQELMSIYADVADTRNIIGEDAAPSDVEAGGGHLVRAQAG